MTYPSLWDVLARLPAASPLIYTGRHVCSAEILLERAASLRSRSHLNADAHIALVGLKATSLIEALVAFDGLTAAILLLPTSVNEDTRNELIAAAGCTHLLTPECQISSLQSPTFTERRTGATRWLLTTSGTTGSPKLIGHTLASLTRTVKNDISTGSRFHWGLLYDPNRFAGLQVVLQALFAGSSLTLPQGSTFQEQIGSIIARPVTALSGTPSLWRKMLMDGRIMSLPLRQITLGGEIADQNLLDVLHRHFPDSRITHIYASTEVGVGFAVNDGRSGFPVDWLEPGKGPVDLKVDERGHLYIRPAVLPDGTVIRQRMSTDGYLDTEDVVRVEQNRVVFLGRASGAINVGGNKVNPESIETILRQVPGVQDARVYAKTSKLVGQLVAADILPMPGYDLPLLRQNIQQYCRQALEHWQMPAIINFVNDLLLTAGSKIERRTS